MSTDKVSVDSRAGSTQVSIEGIVQIVFNASGAMIDIHPDYQWSADATRNRLYLSPATRIMLRPTDEPTA